MKKQSRRWVALIGAGAVMAAIAIYFNYSESQKEGSTVKLEKKSSKPAAKALNVSGIILRPTFLAEELSSVGNIIPDEQVELTFETSGKVIAIYFKEGSEVKKGDLLAKINDATLVAQLKKLEAEIPLLEGRLYRQKMLLAKDAVSQEAFDIVSTDLAKLNADIEQVKANLELTELKAPFDGVVGLRNISEGAFASTGTSLATLTKLKPLKIEFSYPERFSNLVKKGTPIEFTIDGMLEQFNANVYAVEPTVADGIRVQTARAIHPNSKGILTAGRFVNVKITLAKRENAIVVPSEALIAELGKNVVYTYNGGKAKPISVTIGTRTDTHVEILDGVAEADTVLTSGLMQLRPGMAVKLSKIE